MTALAAAVGTDGSLSDKVTTIELIQVLVELVVVALLLVQVRTTSIVSSSTSTTGTNAVLACATGSVPLYHYKNL